MALTPALVAWPPLLLGLAAVVIVLLPWAMVLLGSISRGTRYWFWRSSEVEGMGLSARYRALNSALVFVFMVAAVAGHWLKWPAWWAIAFQNGVLAGPALAILLFNAASIYHTALWLEERGAVKRCAKAHTFSPFMRSCPQCGSRKGLVLVTTCQDS